jgi:hypothetical protein
MDSNLRVAFAAFSQQHVPSQAKGDAPVDYQPLLDAISESLRVCQPSPRTALQFVAGSIASCILDIHLEFEAFVTPCA